MILLNMAHSFTELCKAHHHKKAVIHETGEGADTHYTTFKNGIDLDFF